MIGQNRILDFIPSVQQNETTLHERVPFGSQKAATGSTEVSSSCLMSSIPVLLPGITLPSEQTSSQIEEDIEMTCEVVLEASEETIPLSSQDHQYHQPRCYFCQTEKETEGRRPQEREASVQLKSHHFSTKDLHISFLILFFVWLYK
jgi:hypothetical protein